MYLSSNLPILKTAIPGIFWPALQNLQLANLMSIIYQLEQTQWWSPERLLTMQFQQLNQLLNHAYNTIPFYRERLQQVNITPSNNVNLAQWHNIPLLTRDEIQQQGENLQSNAIPVNHGKVLTTTTSGSTGKPVTVKKTEISQLFWEAFTLRDFYWHQFDFQQKLAIIRNVTKEMREISSYPSGIINQNWGGTLQFIHPTGLGFLLNIRTNVSDQVEWLTRNQPEYILTLASNAFALAEYCFQKGIKFPQLRKIQTFGEVVDTKVRQMCKNAWNILVTDRYSSEEVGYMALQCPEHEHYHLQSEGVYVEILNSQGVPCQPGEIGTIVVTPLHNFAMPLIRYAIGDYAEVGEPCSCGRGLPVVNKILGRTRNMFILPNGEQYWVTLPYYEFMQLVPLKQYQIIQQTLEHIEVRLVVQRAVTVEEEDKMRQMIAYVFKNYPHQISFSYPDKIERSPNGKFEDFISKVAVTL